MENDKSIIMIPVPVGELLDKISILEIKEERITDEQKLKNVRTELALLRDILGKVGELPAEVGDYIKGLKEANLGVWEAEDHIHELEAAGDFGEEFIKYSRQAPLSNDRRVMFKKKINQAMNSGIIEEKSYKNAY